MAPICGFQVQATAFLWSASWSGPALGSSAVMAALPGSQVLVVPVLGLAISMLNFHGNCFQGGDIFIYSLNYAKTRACLWNRDFHRFPLTNITARPPPHMQLYIKFHCQTSKWKDKAVAGNCPHCPFTWYSDVYQSYWNSHIRWKLPKLPWLAFNTYSDPGRTWICNLLTQPSKYLG